jgi:hypothetical protein
LLAIFRNRGAKLVPKRPGRLPQNGHGFIDYTEKPL